MRYLMPFALAAWLLADAVALIAILAALVLP